MAGLVLKHDQNVSNANFVRNCCKKTYTPVPDAASTWDKSDMYLRYAVHGLQLHPWVFDKQKQHTSYILSIFS